MIEFADPCADPEVLAAIESFCLKELARDAANIDAQSIFATCHLPALAKLGIMGLNLPEIYNGAGIDHYTLFEAVALISGACASTGSMVTAHYLATDSIKFGGDDAQKARWLKPAGLGETLGAFALTEPAAGSNPADMTSTATRVKDGYRIKGTKHFISNAGQADFIIVFAKTNMSAGAKGISAFVVETAKAGLLIGTPERTMGLKCGHVFEVVIDCTVPEENRLGAEGTGFRTALRVLDAGRLDIAAACIGIAQAAFSAATEWAKSRHAGSAPIAELQGIRWMLADMATDICAARGLARAATVKRAAGEHYSTEASIAKLFASEMAGRVTDMALQIHGGYGFTCVMPLERYVRDVRIMRIYEGSSEIQRNIIARTVLV